MSEKLSAFAALYAEKAAADVEKQKGNVAKSEEKLKKANELWDALKIETEKSGIFEKFTSVFPQPGGEAIVTDGVSANPNLTTLLSYGDPLESSVKELLKLKNSKARVESTKTALAYAEGLVARKPEDHINMLGHELVKLAANSASGGGNTTESLLKSFFSTYESFKDIMEYEITNVSGPKAVDTSEESYAVLKEKFEAGELIVQDKGAENKESPINEPSGQSQTSDTSSQTGINAGEAVETGENENTTEGTATVTEGKPEITAPAPSPQPETAININLEKKEEGVAPTSTGETIQSSGIEAINIPTSSEGTATSLTEANTTINQQSINLETDQSTSMGSQVTDMGDSNLNTIEGVTNLQESNVSINTPGLQIESRQPESPTATGETAGAVGPLGQLQGESSPLRSALFERLEKMGVPISTINNLQGGLAERIREIREKMGIQSPLNLEQGGPGVGLEVTNSQENITNNSTTLTPSQEPIKTEPMVEKNNPSVSGKPTTATPLAPQPITPPTPDSSPTPTVTEAPAATNNSMVPPTQPQAPSPGQNTFIDVKSLETRLKRIEMALTNPLEVIIKEH